MFELRTDPISSRQVLIAEARAGRPNDFRGQAVPHSDPNSVADCPFCAGHEKSTPAPLMEVAGDDGKWQVRVVPNRYPAIALRQDDIEKPPSTCLGSAAQLPTGAHEVLIESPRHVQDITDLSTAELTVVLQVYRERLRSWAADERIRHTMVFKNVGVAAGASLEHIHSQLVALPNIPPIMMAELQSAERFYAEQQCCLFCRLLEEELEHCRRLVIESDRFVAFCAYASRQPLETWLLPREHAAHYHELSDADTEALAVVLQDLVARFRKLVRPLAYNLILHAAPYGSEYADSYHWHLELVPRSTKLAGFEWGTGMHINPLSPERAAVELRSSGSLSPDSRSS